MDYRRPIFNTLAIFIIVLLTSFWPDISHAKIFKCEGKNGKINFQDKPCIDGNTEEVKLKKSNTLDRNTNLDRFKARPETKSRKQPSIKEHPSYKQNNMLCEQARKAYEQQVIEIKERCKKGRETFCGKSAEEIQKHWDTAFLKKERGDSFSGPSQQWYAFNRGGGAPIFSLKTQIDQYCN